VCLRRRASSPKPGRRWHAATSYTQEPMPLSSNGGSDDGRGTPQSRWLRKQEQIINVEEDDSFISSASKQIRITPVLEGAELSSSLTQSKTMNRQSSQGASLLRRASLTNVGLGLANKLNTFCLAPADDKISKRAQILKSIVSFDSYKLDGEESKVHFEMREGRTKAYWRRLDVLVLSLLILIASIAATIEVVMILVADTGLNMGLEALEHLALWPSEDEVANGTNGAVGSPSTAAGYFAFVCPRIFLVAIAAGLCAWQPSAIGSGMPVVKANLNGADVRLSLPSTILGPMECHLHMHHMTTRVAPLSMCAFPDLGETELTDDHHGEGLGHAACRRGWPTTRTRWPHDPHLSDGVVDVDESAREGVR
jgi:hypothetical protein